jgi:hypothetical protein
VLRGVLVERGETLTGPYVEITTTPLPPEALGSFQDAGIERHRSYWYRLLLLHRDDSITIAGPVRADPAEDGNSETSLQPLVEGPGAGEVTIRYRVGAPNTAVHFCIYDVRGARVRSFGPVRREPGEFVQVWDGRDERRLQVARGLYFVHMSAGAWSATRRIVLLRTAAP